jgi:hypothetical protein
MRGRGKSEHPRGLSSGLILKGEAQVTVTWQNPQLATKQKGEFPFGISPPCHPIFEDLLRQTDHNNAVPEAFETRKLAPTLPSLFRNHIGCESFPVAIRSIPVVRMLRESRCQAS